MIVARLLIPIALLLPLSVVGQVSWAQHSPLVSAREALANQRDFVADLVASDVGGAKRHMRLAKNGGLFRLDYTDGTPTVFVDERFSLWELNPRTATASPEGTVELISLHAPWLLLAFAAESSCFAFKETRDRHERLVKIEVYIPDEADSPMLCTVDRNGLVTRIEFPSHGQGEMGYQLYELKNVKYRVPSKLFSVQLVPQISSYKDEPCPPSGAT